jgi:hypothetical protein
MPDLPTPTAKRLQRPSWRDTRLLIGLLLVLLATTIGAKVVASADDRVPVYVAQVTLKPGDQLTADNLARVDVQLGAGIDRYLSAATGVPANRFALREVRPGELLPLSAVGDKTTVGVQPVTVQADSLSASALVVGSVVDVYVSARDQKTTQERYGEPALMLSAVSVSWLPAGTDRFGAGASTAAVQILVPSAKVAAVLAAIDSQSRVALVPVPGSARKSGS